jgi:hypothetical protein
MRLELMNQRIHTLYCMNQKPLMPPENTEKRSRRRRACYEITRGRHIMLARQRREASRLLAR